jgi:hypothetical protein
MHINKRIIAQLDKVYAVSIMEINGETTYLAASEGPGSCVEFHENNWKVNHIWDEPGGTMTMVPVPGGKNEFVATQKFFPGFQAKESRIVHVQYGGDGKWVVQPIRDIPYLHRFDIFPFSNKLFFIGAVLCEDKEYKEDWSKPGKVYVGELPESLNRSFALHPVLEGITRNHGFCRAKWNNKDAYLISGTEGVFAIYPPETADGEWKTERLLDHEVSDIAVCDIDNDGCMELAAIEPFHGSRGIIYKNKDGKLLPIHEHEYEFGHVVWGGKILNKPSFIIGGRQGNRELNCFQMDEASGRIQHFTIDNTGGPSNIAVLNKEKSAVILAANRDIGEIAVYEITK